MSYVNVNLLFTCLNLNVDKLQANFNVIYFVVFDQAFINVMYSLKLEVFVGSCI